MEEDGFIHVLRFLEFSAEMKRVEEVGYQIIFAQAYISVVSQALHVLELGMYLGGVSNYKITTK